VSNFRLIVLLCWFTIAQMWGTAQAAPDDYRLGAGDLVRISVFNHPDLTTEARVSESGNLTFPMIGQVPVAGLSARRAEQYPHQAERDAAAARKAAADAAAADADH